MSQLQEASPRAGASGATGATPSAGFYEYQIANSIRGSADDDRTLKFTAGTPTSADTFTMAYWVKRQTTSTDDAANNIFVTGTGGGTYFYISLGLDLFFEGAGGNWSTSYLQTSAAYRDTSAWYHHILVFDSTQSAENDRLKIYVNGERITSFAQDSMHGNIGSSEDFSFINQSGIVQAFGGLSGKGHGTEGADLSLADVMFFDGQAYYSELGETKNGVWIPKDPSSLTFGNNGYWLKFTNSSNLGEDFSGNDNDFTVANFASHDQMTDTPTFNSDSNGGNFPTYNPLLKPPSGLALSEGNLKATLTSDDNGIMTNWQVPITGKWYWEIDIDNIASDHGVYVGVMPANTDLTINQEQNDLGLVYYSINGNSILKGTRSSYGATFTTGDIISIAVDRDADTLQFYKNGAGQGTISISSLDEEFFCYMGYTGGSGPCSTILNFGQEGTFAGNVTAGGYSDGTGYGNFKYTVPTGFLAICSGNQPVADAVDPAQTDDNYPQKLFGATIWTGDGSTGRAITGLGFQPDWVWFKARSSAFSHRLYDTTRGITSNGGYRLSSNTTGAQLDKTSSGQDISAVGTDGFTLGASSNLYTNDTNSGGLHLAWTWRANGGTTSTNSNGSTDSTVQVDPSGHFSIVKFEGQNDSWGNPETIGHGLSSAPTCMILKNYDKTDEWSVFFSDYGDYSIGGSNPASNSLVLNTGDPLYTNQSYKGWGGVMPTSTVFTVDGNNNNGASESIIVYCFANCEGYIKSGTYVGNANADGTFVYTGFRPAFVMVKYLGSGESWVMLDNKRDGYNPTNKNLRANNEYAESSGSTYDIDFLSNGFKPRTTWEGLNGSGYVIVYLAMAHNPFKYATAR